MNDQEFTLSYIARAVVKAYLPWPRILEAQRALEKGQEHDLLSAVAEWNPSMASLSDADQDMLLNLLTIEEAKALLFFLTPADTQKFAYWLIDSHWGETT